MTARSHEWRTFRPQVDALEARNQPGNLLLSDAIALTAIEESLLPRTPQRGQQTRARVLTSSSPPS